MCVKTNFWGKTENPLSIIYLDLAYWEELLSTCVTCAPVCVTSFRNEFHKIHLHLWLLYLFLLFPSQLEREHTMRCGEDLSWLRCCILHADMSLSLTRQNSVVLSIIFNDVGGAESGKAVVGEPSEQHGKNRFQCTIQFLCQQVYFCVL